LKLNPFLEVYHRLNELNRYVLASGLFLLWMCTFAEVDVIRMLQTHLERGEVEQRIAQTQEDISGLDERIAALDRDPTAKERHARETYYMHRSNEDVFVFR
jgi:cell division protein FtsB